MPLFFCGDRELTDTIPHDFYALNLVAQKALRLGYFDPVYILADNLSTKFLDVRMLFHDSQKSLCICGNFVIGSKQ